MKDTRQKDKFRVSSFKIQNAKYNVQDVNLSRLYYMWGGNVKPNKLRVASFKLRVKK